MWPLRLNSIGVRSDRRELSGHTPRLFEPGEFPIRKEASDLKGLFPRQTVCLGPFPGDLRTGELDKNRERVRLQDGPFYILARL